MRKLNKTSTLYATIVMFICIFVMVITLELLNDLSYKPICQRHAEEQGFTYTGYSFHYRVPSVCKFEAENAAGDVTQIEVKVSQIRRTPVENTTNILKYIILVGVGSASVYAIRKVGRFDE
jgi:hypothetical protein